MRQISDINLELLLITNAVVEMKNSYRYGINHENEANRELNFHIRDNTISPEDRDLAFAKLQYELDGRFPEGFYDLS
ncbi:MAG: hypothetical protein AABX19_02785 [Nanoarchaeota archaeon]